LLNRTLVNIKLIYSNIRKHCC